jgi:hypothetical protein
MQYYMAWELIQQRGDEMRARASRDGVARQARTARRALRAQRAQAARLTRDSQQSREAGWDEVAAAKPTGLPRVPGNPASTHRDVDDTLRDIALHSHAC